MTSTARRKVKKEIIWILFVAVIVIGGLVLLLNKIDERGSLANPEFTQEAYTMGSISIVEWGSRFEPVTVQRVYDEQTHMVCYVLSGKPLGCSTLDMGILPETMKTGKEVPFEEPIQESHHMWQEGAPDVTAETPTAKDKL